MARPSLARSFDVEYIPPALSNDVSVCYSLHVEMTYGFSSAKSISHPLSPTPLGIATIEAFGGEILVLVMRRGCNMPFDKTEPKVLLLAIFSMA
jgi:hypothetical protein